MHQTQRELRDDFQAFLASHDIIIRPVVESGMRKYQVTVTIDMTTWSSSFETEIGAFGYGYHLIMGKQ